MYFLIYKTTCMKAFRSLTEYINMHENKENSGLITDLCVTDQLISVHLHWPVKVHLSGHMEVLFGTFLPSSHSFLDALP